MEFATDREAKERRDQLISAGVIKPNRAKVIVKAGQASVDTKESSANLRKQMIGKGLINPDYVKYPEPSPALHIGKEEGEYTPRKIISHSQYLRRRAIYFWMLQVGLILDE